MSNEAPKKIWVWDYAAHEMVNDNHDSTDVPYIRAVHDLVDSMTKDLSPEDDEEVRQVLTEEFRFWRRG